MIAVVAISLVVLFLLILNFYISATSHSYIYNRIEEVPVSKCGLLLGTSKYKIEGGINPFFKNRLDAAAQLFFAGKIEYIIASGYREKFYNEPEFMISGLKERGVPAERIIPDFEGFRTFDSVVRAKQVFGQKCVTVISQKFHNERAIYIANKIGLKMYGFNADDPEDFDIWHTWLREIFARAKVFIDLNLMDAISSFTNEKFIIK